jgi:hypothetical protein
MARFSDQPETRVSRTSTLDHRRRRSIGPIKLLAIVLCAMAWTSLPGCNGGSGGLPLTGPGSGGPGGPAPGSPGPGSGAPAACEVPGGFVKLSKCIGGDADKTVVIGGPSGTGDCKGGTINAYVDQASLSTGRITINAGSALKVFDRTAQLPMGLETTGIDVFGTLEIGNSDCPIGTITRSTKVTFTFKGKKDPACVGNACGGFVKGIQVEKGGSLRMFGIKGVPDSITSHSLSWTYLRLPAGPASLYGTGKGVSAPVASDGDQVIHLADDVGDPKNTHAWQPNDWIAVGTTSFSPFETEVVKIQNVTSLGTGGSDIILDPKTKLLHYHFGGTAPTAGTSTACKDIDGKGGVIPASFCDDATRDYGVDERAEVALLSRSIKLTAQVPFDPADPQGNHWGGEMKFLQGFTEVSIQGVELEKFGKDKLGSYPLHFHMDGDLTPNDKGIPKVLVNANSIHHSYNKCVTVHSTQNLTIQNNVCVRITGHIFYQELGDESKISYLNNVGLGAMSHWFDIDATKVPTVPMPGDATKQVPKDYWVGDYLTNNPAHKAFNSFNPFNIPNMDSQSNPTHGSCYVSNGNGGLNLAPRTVGSPPPPPGTPPCLTGEFYEEWSSGFWILNPNSVIQGNSIGGCQGIGVAYWYVPSAVDTSQTAAKFQPLGLFQNNRAHGCYDGVFGETMFGIRSDQLFPRVGGKLTGQNILAYFDGLVSFRNRDRGFWLRPVWYVLQNSRLATNRDDVTLVSSGGNEGNAPGVWSLLKDSVLVGLSRNNVDRFGPCPSLTPGSSNNFGCVDLNPKANDELERGYPTPAWNIAGFMIYDGPVRIFHDRFVNFNSKIADNLTNDDQTALKNFTGYYNGHTTGPYEGDAALGWLQNNQSSYPTATAVKGLIFENTDLRHQIYTERVNLGDFQDGDQNTALIDMDGSLTGFKAVDSGKKAVPGLFPISLNNLPFNASSNSVDECLAMGAQDAAFEGRPTSLISPGDMGTLEFFALWPNPPGSANNIHGQQLTFTKDSTDYKQHQLMKLRDRNALGAWEPKVTSGFGYTISAQVDKSKLPPPPNQCTDANKKDTTCAGIPNIISVGLSDVVQPNISASNPFFVRVGICYTDQSGKHPSDASLFTISRGYRSYGGNGVGNFNDPELLKYFNNLNGAASYLGQQCFNLDGQVPNLDLDPAKGCPANGVTPASLGCTAPNQTKGAQCVYPVECTKGDPNCPCPSGTSCGRIAFDSKKQFVSVNSIGDLTNADGTPKNYDAYYYDPVTGMLFFYVTQDLPNAFGPSPLGSCHKPPQAGDSPDCPDLADGESYYTCPAAGCQTYLVKLNDKNYVPGPSNCNGTDPTAIYSYQGGIYEQPSPPGQNQLVYAEDSSLVVRKLPDPQISSQGFQHSVASRDPKCANPTPAPTPLP